MRPWFSGRMGPCQGLDASSILAGRTLLDFSRFRASISVSILEIIARRSFREGGYEEMEVFVAEK